MAIKVVNATKYIYGGNSRTGTGFSMSKGFAMQDSASGKFLTMGNGIPYTMATKKQMQQLASEINPAQWGRVSGRKK